MASQRQTTIRLTTDTQSPTHDHMAFLDISRWLRGNNCEHSQYLRYSQAVAVWTSHTDTDWSFVNHADELAPWLRNFVPPPPYVRASPNALFPISVTQLPALGPFGGWLVLLQFIQRASRPYSMGVNDGCFSASHHSARVSGLLRQCRRRWPPCLIMDHSCSDQAPHPCRSTFSKYSASTDREGKRQRKTPDPAPRLSLICC
jgi:hypothetical protein